MVSRKILASLVIAAIVLPMALGVLVGVARLLSAGGDEAGAAVLGWIALATGILWAIDLVSLVVALGINALGSTDRPPEEEE